VTNKDFVKYSLLSKSLPIGARCLETILRFMFGLVKAVNDSCEGGNPKARVLEGIRNLFLSRFRFVLLSAVAMENTPNPLYVKGAVSSA